MAFNLGVADFFEFITRPFTNPIGWILLIGVAIYIYLRITGKIGGIKLGGNKRGGQGGTTADYVIK